MDLFLHNASLRRTLERHLRSFDRRRLDREGRRPAAVTLAVCRDGDAPAIVITRRAASLRAHSRQWALPGGRTDQGETAVAGALRELHEEVGLQVGEAAVMGVLDDYATRSGYVITPVVVWSDVDCKELAPNPGEVEVIHPFTFKELARRDSPILHSIEESDRDVLSMHFHKDRIYAPTGAMLYQFREVALFGRQTRVAHFEQPRFAWR